MQQQPPPPQPGGSQFGAPPSSSAPRAQVPGIPPPDYSLPEAASPISSRAPPAAGANFDELGPAVAAGGFPDEDALAAGEDAERGGQPGNRWPRQETLALLKIRSDMDAAFRDATFKGPLWEEVSRKLAKLGYKRSSKKCKEKFENVHKYYKRTKEGRAGRQDGKAYRFFDQLEALHSSSGAAGATTPTATVGASPTTFSFSTHMAGPSAARVQPLPISAAAPPPATTTPTRPVVPELGLQGISSSAAAAAAAAGISFSSNSESNSDSESDDEEMEEAGVSRKGRKRKRRRDSRYRGQMMAFFEGLMKQVMERQEAMQQRFLEAIEKREQERMKREEAWRLQEMTRLNREQELLVQERNMAASRDTAVISYLQKISGGQSIPFPVMPTHAAAAVVAPLNSKPTHADTTPPLSLQATPPPLSQKKHELQRHNQPTDVAQHQFPALATQLVSVSSEPQENLGGSGSYEPTTSSRWPKTEVHALIKLRSELESRYQETGPKGPLWEEISAGMQRLGYSRSSKRCKEKWENINKYFKKVKESNKKRPEDSKTCPYFHELDALYRRKHSAAGSGAGTQQQREQDIATNRSPPTVQEQPLTTTEAQAKNSGGNNDSYNSNNSGNSDPAGEVPTATGVQVQTSNGGHPPSFFEEGMKKPEDIVKELMEQRQLQHQRATDEYDRIDEADSDNLDQDEDDDDDDDDEDSKMHYKIQFQRPNVSGGGGGSASTAAAAAAATAAGSFLAMVQ